MFDPRCFAKYKAGDYAYKNGIHIKRISKNKWEIYTVYNDKKNILATCKTLKDCKYWIAYN